MGTLKSKIFILHGWTYSTEKWNPFIDLLKKNGLELHLLNVPGLTQETNRPWKIDDYVDWLKQILDKEKNKVILIGHSNGGRIALNFAIKYPDKLSHLILIDSAGVYHNELSLKIKRLVFGSVAKIGKKLSTSETLRSILYKIVGESDYKNATPVMKQTMLNLVNSDKSLSLDKVEVPTLIIWGREDKTTPLSDGKIMHGFIKNSKLQIIEGACHSPMFTHATEVANAIVNNLTI
jgi:pimeloyl-ACP methyl ester carboxylesterase